MDVRSVPGIGGYHIWSGLRFAVACDWGLRLDRSDLDLMYMRDADEDDHRRLTEIMTLYFYWNDGQRDVQARKAAKEMPSLLLFR